MKKSLIFLISIIAVSALAISVSAMSESGITLQEHTDTAPSISNGDFIEGDVFFNGEYTERIRLNLASTDILQVQNQIYEGMKAHKTEINLSSYELTPEALKSIVTRVMDTYPDLFHVDNKYGYTTSGGYVYSVKPQYKMTQVNYNSALAVYNAEIDKITSVASKLSNDLEKVLYVHDYIAANYEYDTDYKIYDVYNFIKSKKGVCQSYTLMFLACANELGIDASWAQSSDMNHIWNVVKIDGAYYHLDITWDDPIGIIPYNAKHTYFLLSDSEMLEREHYNWTSDYTCTSTKYDDAFWSEVRSPFAALEDDLYYIDPTAKTLNSFDGVTFTTDTLKTFNYVWNVVGASSYYPGMWSGISVYNNVIYVNSTKEIFAYVAQTGEFVSVYTSTRSDAHIYSSSAEDGSFKVYYSAKPDNSGSVTVVAFPTSLKNISVTWKYGTQTKKQSYMIGDIPSYDGDLGDVYLDGGYHNSFVKWDKEATPIVSATTFEAVFEKEAHSFKNGVCSCSMVEEDDGPKVLYYGNCQKDGFSWTIDEDGVLTVSGTGAMHNSNSWTYNDWWEHRSYVKTIVVSQGVTHIGNYAFVGIPFEKITLPASLTSIGEGAFKNCSNFKTISIPSSVVKIADAAFVNCTALESISLPSALTTLGQQAFYNCENLNNVAIPNGVTTIEASAFYNCKSLATLVLPSKITSIKSYAFYGCKKLTSIILPVTLTQIGTAAFRSSGLVSITIPSGVTSVLEYAFFECTSLTNANIPSSITSISAYTFSGSALKSISIPTSVKSIGEGAFSYCTMLTSVTIPNSVTDIGSSAFAFCEKLASVTLSSNLKVVRELTFHGCTAIKSITIPSSVTTIENDAFCECTLLGSVELKDGLTTIGQRAFAFTALKEIIIPKTVTKLEGQIFASCNELDTIYLAATKISDGWSSSWSDSCNAKIKFKDSVGFYSATVVMESKLTINFLVSSSAFENCDKIYASFKRYYADDRGTVTNVIQEYKVNGAYWVFAVTGIATKEINDRIDATLFAVKDGITYEYKYIEYGVSRYAKNRLSKTEISQEEKRLLVDMLNFGAMAQTYLNYATDDLANSFLTQAQKEFGSYSSGDALSLTSVKNYVRLENEEVSFASVSALFKDSVQLKYQMNLSKYTGDKSALSVLLTYEDVKGNMHERVYSFSDMQKQGSYYTITFDEIAIKDMGTVVKTVIYENYGTASAKAISGTATYSIESYAASKQDAGDEKLSDLVCHMIAFSRSAKEFFSK